MKTTTRRSVSKRAGASLNRRTPAAAISASLQFVTKSKAIERHGAPGAELNRQVRWEGRQQDPPAPGRRQEERHGEDRVRGPEDGGRHLREPKHVADPGPDVVGDADQEQRSPRSGRRAARASPAATVPPTIRRSPAGLHRRAESRGRGPRYSCLPPGRVPGSPYDYTPAGPVTRASARAPPPGPPAPPDGTKVQWPPPRPSATLPRGLVSSCAPRGPEPRGREDTTVRELTAPWRERLMLVLILGTVLAGCSIPFGGGGTPRTSRPRRNGASATDSTRRSSRTWSGSGSSTGSDRPRTAERPPRALAHSRLPRDKGPARISFFHRLFPAPVFVGHLAGTGISILIGGPICGPERPGAGLARGDHTGPRSTALDQGPMAAGQDAVGPFPRDHDRCTKLGEAVRVAPESGWAPPAGAGAHPLSRV